MLEKGLEELRGPIQASDIERSKLQMRGAESTLRPFGKAFYGGEADYFVYPLPLINAFVSRVLFATLGTFPILGALRLAAGYLYGWLVQLHFRFFLQYVSCPDLLFRDHALCSCCFVAAG